MGKKPWEIKEDAQRRRRDVAFTAFSFGGSLVGGLVFANALWAEICLFPALYFSLDYGATFLRPECLPKKRPLIQVFIALLLCASIWMVFLRDVYHEQLSSITQGDLVPLAEPRMSPTEDPILQVGDGGVFFVLYPGSQGHIPGLPIVVYRAGLRLNMDSHGVVVTTPVKDRQGQLVAEITNNHWRVYPPFCSEKNYTRNSLEVKDGSGEVIFQVALIGNRAQIQGVWRDAFGKGVEMIKTPHGADMPTWVNADGEKSMETEISPIFNYPSAQHLGELVTKRQ